MQTELICEKEQLHHMGEIQPFGVLIAVSKENNTVTHVSENIGDLGIAGAKGLLGKELSGDIANLFSRHFDASQLENTDIFGHELNGKNYFVKPYSTNMHNVLEFLFDYSHHKHNKKTNKSYLYEHPSTNKELLEFSQKFVENILDILQVEKVMLYKFMKDWSGEVIAEVCTNINALGEYLGLRFPASDIPKIARNLYQLNPVRQIPDATATPVKILSYKKTNLDLSNSELRAVSKVHLTYLNNMGVQSSLSFRVLLGDNLWALVACHNTTPYEVPQARIEEVKEIVKLYEIAIRHAHSKMALAEDDHIYQLIQKLSTDIKSYSKIADFIDAHKEKIHQYFDADGLCFITNDSIITSGIIPGQESIEYLAMNILNRQTSTYCTSNILDAFADSHSYVGPPGLMAIVVSNLNSPGKSLLLLFREHSSIEVKWAGNPNEKMHIINEVGIVNPRHSFEKWVETNISNSEEWKKSENHLAISLVGSVQ